MPPLSSLKYCQIVTPRSNKIKTTELIPLKSSQSQSSANFIHDPTGGSNNNGSNNTINFVFRKVIKFLKLCPDGSNCYC